MPVVRGRKAVERLYEEAAKRGWVVPTFCTENQTTTEAIIAACQLKADELGMRIPITIGITGQYLHRSQSTRYARSGNAATGRLLYFKDCEILSRPDGDYPDVDVMTHFDHGQLQHDYDVLEGDMSGFSSVMFDQSEVPWEENLLTTAEFVRKHGAELFIEGACDEVVDAEDNATNSLTTPERALEFLERTGVDMVVANLGTEHRASSQDLKYHPEAARAISEVVGSRLVLHGTSSVPPEQLDSLYEDGVCKVNIWTTLERDSAPVVLRDMLEHANAVVGEGIATQLREEGLLGANAPVAGRPDMDFFATTRRQEVAFEVMRSIVKGYLDRWYTIPTRHDPALPSHEG